MQKLGLEKHPNTKIISRTWIRTLMSTSCSKLVTQLSVFKKT